MNNKLNIFLLFFLLIFKTIYILYQMEESPVELLREEMEND